MIDEQFDVLVDVLNDLATSLRVIAAVQAEEIDVDGLSDLDALQEPEL